MFNYHRIKLEINNIKITGNKHLETKQHTLSNPWVKEEKEIKVKEIRSRKIKQFELNESENTTYHGRQDTAKTALKGKFIALSAYIRQEEPVI